MAKIGNFGNLIVFETSDSRILNFNNFQRTVSASWKSHERIGKKPLSEFAGPELQEITFSVTLNAQYGIQPRKVLENLEKAVETGQVEFLIIGAAKIGKNRWKIVKMSEAWETILNRGELLKATVNLTMEEYL